MKINGPLTFHCFFLFGILAWSGLSCFGFLELHDGLGEGQVAAMLLSLFYAFFLFAILLR
jgi:hypothetical protein